MQLDGVGEVIAARTLKLQNDEGASSEVSVLLGKPQPTPDQRDYYCPYQIKGAGSEKVKCSYGIDAVQALLLTLSILSVQLEVLNKETGGRLSWEGDENGGFGFPEMPPAIT